jgi:hypothetical protein
MAGGGGQVPGSRAARETIFFLPLLPLPNARYFGLRLARVGDLCESVAGLHRAAAHFSLRRRAAVVKGDTNANELGGWLAKTTATAGESSLRKRDKPVPVLEQ